MRDEVRINDAELDCAPVKVELGFLSSFSDSSLARAADFAATPLCIVTKMKMQGKRRSHLWIQSDPEACVAAFQLGGSEVGAVGGNRVRVHVVLF